MGQYEGAIADYDEAIRINPNYATDYNSRGFTKRRLGQYEGAIADYDEAIRLKPDFAIAYNDRGKAKVSLGCTEEAKADFQKALELAEQAGNKILQVEIEQQIQELDNAETAAKSSP